MPPKTKVRKEQQVRKKWETLTKAFDVIVAKYADTEVGAS